MVVVGAPQCYFYLTSSAWEQKSYGNGYFSVYSCTSASCLWQSQTAAPTGSSSHFASSCFGFSVALTNNGQFLAVGAPAYYQS